MGVSRPALWARFQKLKTKLSRGPFASTNAISIKRGLGVGKAGSSETPSHPQISLRSSLLNGGRANELQLKLALKLAVNRSMSADDPEVINFA